MRICVIPSSYPNEDGVGNTFVEQLVNALVALGHICMVVSPLNTFGNNNVAKYKERETKVLSDGNTVEVYRPRYWNRNIPLVPVSITENRLQWVFEKTIKKFNLQFDCIYCHFFASALPVWHYAHKHNIPLFVATGESKIRDHFQKPCWSFTWEKFKRDTNGVVCVSTKNLEECISLGYADPEKCKVFPNGANLDVFKPLDKKECRRKLGYSENDFICATVGEISQRKGQTRIIEAIDSLSNPVIKTLFIGKGDLLPERAYNLHTGKVLHHELTTYLNSADVFVLPTLREGCCNAIVEAMACGLPIISSDRKFNYDILDGSNSIMVDPENSSQIASAINELYSNAEKRQTLAEGALAKAAMLSIVQRAENILRFIDERKG